MTGHLILCWIERFFAGLVLFVIALALLVGLVWIVVKIIEAAPSPCLHIHPWIKTFVVFCGYVIGWVIAGFAAMFIFYHLGEMALAQMGICTRH